MSDRRLSFALMTALLVALSTLTTIACAGAQNRRLDSEPTVNCEGVWVKASVAPDGTSYTVQIGPDGQVREYQTRKNAS